MTTSRPAIDIFCHILPDKYRKALYAKAQRSVHLEDLEGTARYFPALTDLQLRLKLLDRHEGMRQVLTIISPPAEVISPAHAVELSSIANEEMAELAAKYPNKFLGGVACLPLNDIDASLREAERAVKELKLKGVQIYTPCVGKPLDSPILYPLYEMMTRYDLPVWLHPARAGNIPDYEGEKESKYQVFLSIGWPYETTVGMVRLVRGGVLERFPSLKIITHHLGGMAPYFIGRLTWGGKKYNEAISAGTRLSRPPLEYFRMFYGDTVIGDNVSGLMCGYSLFGAEHMLFASDIPTPLDDELKIVPVEKMPVTGAEKSLIFEGNAKRLLHL